jgi:hypothetical protein
MIDVAGGPDAAINVLVAGVTAASSARVDSMAKAAHAIKAARQNCFGFTRTIHEKMAPDASLLLKKGAIFRRLPLRPWMGPAQNRTYFLNAPSISPFSLLAFVASRVN